MAALNCGTALWSWGQKTTMLTQIVLRLNQLVIFQNSHGEGLLNVNCLRICIRALLRAAELQAEAGRNSKGTGAAYIEGKMYELALELAEVLREAEDAEREEREDSMSSVQQSNNVLNNAREHVMAQYSADGGDVTEEEEDFCDVSSPPVGSSRNATTPAPPCKKACRQVLKYEGGEEQHVHGQRGKGFTMGGASHLKEPLNKVQAGSARAQPVKTVPMSGSAPGGVSAEAAALGGGWGASGAAGGCFWCLWSCLRDWWRGCWWRQQGCCWQAQAGLHQPRDPSSTIAIRPDDTADGEQQAHLREPAGVSADGH